MTDTIQAFIKAARNLSDPAVLQYAIIFHAALQNPEGAVKRGKNNEAMRKLRSLGFFTLDKKSVSLPGWDPTWHITDAGRAALLPQDGKVE
jgi:hypothetical protein